MDHIHDHEFESLIIHLSKNDDVNDSFTQNYVTQNNTFPIKIEARFLEKYLILQSKITSVEPKFLVFLHLTFSNIP